MPTKTTASQIQDIGFVVAAAKKHAKALPPAASAHAKAMQVLQAELQAANIEQEQLKSALKAKTAQINDKLKAARALRLRVVRLAEGTFGPDAAQLADFRPVGEG